MNEVLIEPIASGVEIIGASLTASSDILTPEAIDFVITLERQFRSTRKSLLASRAERQLRIDHGEMPDFLTSTRDVRHDRSWRVGNIPADLQNRRVEITGPVDRKMMINALNSGARVFMADLEDALSPTWENVVGGQAALADAVRRRLTFSAPDGRGYRLGERLPTLLVRPRGWHLDEAHLLVDRAPVSGSLFDFGLYVFHNGREALDRGTGPYLYLAKLQAAEEAALWHDVFVHAEAALGLPAGSIRATVLIETIRPLQ